MPETARSNASDHSASGPRSPRVISLVGPYLSGKTTLLEAILARTGAIQRAGSVTAGTSVGDASPEARAHAMSVTLTVAETRFLDDTFVFVDCPGSIEFQHEAEAALAVSDAAVVVCEADAKRVPALQLLLRRLENAAIPHFVFLNKIDTCSTPVRDIIPLLQPASAIPLVLRQVPIWENGIATGFVDLASERAYVYREHMASTVAAVPDELREREQSARFAMLETLADYDDELMEQLLSDIAPPADKVFDDLADDLRNNLICPVFLGSAAQSHGISRLLKALRHEAPFVDRVVKRLGVPADRPAAYVFKTTHSAHGGKSSIARILAGELRDGENVVSATGAETRISGLSSLLGEAHEKCPAASAGAVVAIGRLDAVKTGEIIAVGKHPATSATPLASPAPAYAVALALQDRKDEVKLSAALTKLTEEDPSLSVVHDGDTHQIVLSGQGDMHLRVALERLTGQFGVRAHREPRRVAYRETIRGSVDIRGRHKKQSGGHGQFGDVVIGISPTPRGSGFSFADEITGGVVPRQYISSVEIGVTDYLKCGPLGFPVVDVAVTLKDGSYHAVDSSDMAFRQAARLAMTEGMPKCHPVLLEPILLVEFLVPNDSTARVTGMIAQRRGHMLGYDARDGWPGWDRVDARIPAAEVDDLIIELRSATSGVGTFTSCFDHLAELTGRLADQVLAAHRDAAE